MTSGDDAFDAGVSFVQYCHLVVFIVQLTTGAVLLGLATRDTDAFSIPLYTLYTNTTSKEVRLTDAWVPVPVTIGHFDAGYASSAFLFMSALNHCVCAMGIAGICAYTEWVGRNRASPIRWIEYAFSASLMHIQIAVLCGILDVHLLATIGALTATTMVFGLAQELQKDRSFMLYVLGFIPWLAQWAVILSYFNHGVREANAPVWIYTIIVTEIILDSTFAAVLVFQERASCPCSGVDGFENVDGVENVEGGYTGDSVRMLYYDVAFIVLSLTAKQLLAWLNYWGAHH